LSEKLRKKLHASSVDKIPSVQAILNLDLEMENKLPAPRCKTIKLANFLKDVEARTDIPALTRVDTGVPSALQLATMAICLFLVPSQLSESEPGNLYNCLK
jgi:hypothetical protein